MVDATIMSGPCMLLLCFLFCFCCCCCFNKDSTEGANSSKMCLTCVLQYILLERQTDRQTVHSVLGTTKHSSAIVLTLGNKVILYCINDRQRQTHRDTDRQTNRQRFCRYHLRKGLHMRRVFKYVYVYGRVWYT